MFAPEVLGPTVARLVALADGGRALELAIGTGRVAVPLSEHGVPVSGIELSAPMVARLREKVDEDTVPVVWGGCHQGCGATVGVREDGYILLDTYDTLRQHVVSDHFTFDEQGGHEARISRSPHRYIWPAELDLMAQLAGFVLESREADWVGTPFTAESPSHVSVYRLT